MSAPPSKWKDFVPELPHWPSNRCLANDLQDIFDPEEKNHVIALHELYMWLSTLTVLGPGPNRDTMAKCENNRRRALALEFALKELGALAE